MEKRKKKRNNILIEGENKKLFVCLAFNYSVQSYIDVYCSYVGKKFTYTTTKIVPFLYMVVLKIVF